jgi:hypothetical protein
VSEHAVQRSRHLAEIECTDEQRRVADLPVPHEAPELLVIALLSLRQLLPEGAERPELALSRDDLFHGSGAERAHQLVLEVRLADVKTEPLHVGASEVGAEAGALQPSPKVALLSRVAEARQRDVQPLRTESAQKASDRLRAAHRHDGHAFGVEVTTTALGQRRERALVADPFDEDDGLHETSIVMTHHVVTIDDVRAIAAGLPRSYEAFVRGRVKFRVGRIVYLAFSRDETLLGFAFPREEREAALQTYPDKFQRPKQADLRYNWLVVRLAAIDEQELRELVFDAWRMVVPKRLAAASDEELMRGLVRDD